MKVLFRLFGTVVALLSIGAYASNPFHKDQPTTFLGPTLTGSYGSLLTDETAFSIFGEAGFRNLRGSGSFGFKINEAQNLKLTAEGLLQDIRYDFFSGVTDQWINQATVGLGYEYEFVSACYHPALDIAAYYSHANNKSLNTRIIHSEFITFINQRRIGGGNAAGIAPGVSVMPWPGGRLAASLDYDHVNYNTRFNDRDEDNRGFGGTIHLNQQILENIGFGVSAAFRQPFNSYTAAISWTNCPWFGSWTVGANGAYTIGKNRLPDAYNVGLFANYSIEPAPRVASHPISLKGEEAAPVLTTGNLLHFTERPAVYLPEVLAIADEKVSFIN